MYERGIAFVASRSSSAGTMIDGASQRPRTSLASKRAMIPSTYSEAYSRSINIHALIKWLASEYLAMMHEESDAKARRSDGCPILYCQRPESTEPRE